MAAAVNCSVIPEIIFKWCEEVVCCHTLMCAALWDEMLDKGDGELIGFRSLFQITAGSKRYVSRNTLFQNCIEYQNVILRQESPCSRLLSAYAHTQVGCVSLALTEALNLKPKYPPSSRLVLFMLLFTGLLRK